MEYENKMILLKSAQTKETEKGDLVRVYLGLDQAKVLRQELRKIENNNVRLDIHIIERKGPRGSFLSGFMFCQETDPNAGKEWAKKNGKDIKGFQEKDTKGKAAAPKQKDNASKDKKAKTERLKKKFQKATGEE